MRLTRQRCDALDLTVFAGRGAGGMTLHVLPMPGFARRFTLLAARFGSVDREFRPAPGAARVRVPGGIAHFLEHKLFEEEYGDAFARFAELGAEANAATGPTTTHLMFGCTRAFDENLALLLGLVERLHTDEAGVEREKDIIVQEILMYRDDPGSFGVQTLLEGLYHRHPVREDIAGTPADVRRTTLADLHRCHAAFYHPARLALFVAGDVDPRAVAAQVDARLARRPAPPPVARFFPAEPGPVRRRAVERTRDVATPQLFLGVKDGGLPRGRCADPRYELALNLLYDLTLRRGAPLYDELFAADLLGEQFSASYRSERGFGYSLLSGESRDPRRLAARLRAALPELAAAPIDPAEFARKKRQAYGHFLHRFNRPESAAYHLMNEALKDQPPFAWLDLLAALTPADLRRAARRHFRPERIATVILRPGRARARRRA